MSRSNFFSNVYVPNLTDNQKKIIRDAPRPRTMEDIQEEVSGKLKEVENFFKQLGVNPEVNEEPRILTEREAESVIEARLRMLEDTKRIMEKVNAFDEAIDLEIGPKGFDYSFKRKPRLRRAIKAITGKAKNVITYEDYKLALSVKKKLEQQEINDLANQNEED